MPELLKPNESAFKEPAIAPTPVPTAISATELQTPATPFKVTPAAPATQSAGLEALIGTQNDAFTKDLEAKTKAAESTRTDAFSELVKQYGKSEGEVSLTDKAYASTVDPAEAELRDINQQIFAEQQASRREVERLQKNPQGLFGGALDQKVQEIQDKSLARQADLSVIQLARQGKFDSAKSIADRAVAARLEKQRTKLEALKLNYEENKDLFTTAEKREFETKQGDRERALDKQEADLKQISDLSLNALQNGAPTSIATAMRQAKTVGEAIQIGGGYIDALDRRLKNAQIQKTTGVDDTFNTVSTALDFAISNLPKDRRENAVSTVNSYLKQGKTTEAQAYIDKLIVDNLPASQREDISAMGTVSKLANQLVELNAETGLEGIGGLYQGSIAQAVDNVFGNSSEEARKTRALIGNIKGTIAKLRGGTSFTENEQKLLDTYTPTINENPAVVVNKLNLLNDYIEKKKQDTLYPGGIGISKPPSTEQTGNVENLRSKYNY